MEKIRDNMGMQDNIRILFSALWFPATGILLATLMVFVLTLGNYWEYFLASLIAWTLITSIVWAVSLNA